jgi:selenocysteine lyase/cysteine desulfurase
MALAALETVTGWSPAHVSAAIAPLAEAIVDGITALGLQVTPPPRAHHILGARLPAGSAVDIQRALFDARVHVSVRGSTLRISPYVFNTQHDVVRLLGALRAAL